MATCNICKYAGTPSYKSPCSECKGYSKYEYEKQQTNADCIRAMSDEELAEFLESTHSNLAIKLGGKYIVRGKEYIEIWLQQPAEVPK